MQNNLIALIFSSRILVQEGRQVYHRKHISVCRGERSQPSCHQEDYLYVWRKLLFGWENLQCYYQQVHTFQKFVKKKKEYIFVYKTNFVNNNVMLSGALPCRACVWRVPCWNIHCQTPSQSAKCCHLVSQVRLHMLLSYQKHSLSIYVFASKSSH